MVANDGDEPSADLRGAAFHEAGHAIVAVSVGLTVTEIEIGIDGDDSKGEAKTVCPEGVLVSFINQLAVCVAGRVAQEIFEAPLQEHAGSDDLAKMVTLLADVPGRESRALREAAYARAREILEANKGAVEEVAKRLMRERLVRNP